MLIAMARSSKCANVMQGAASSMSALPSRASSSGRHFAASEYPSSYAQRSTVVRCEAGPRRGEGWERALTCAAATDSMKIVATKTLSDTIDRMPETIRQHTLSVRLNRLFPPL